MKYLLIAVLMFGGMMSNAQAPEIRYIVIHKAGKAWNPSLSMFEQPYIFENPDSTKPDQTHVKYFAKLLANKKLAFGGPFPTSSGTIGAEVGMMIPVATVTEKEIKDFAANDPAVQAGVLDFEIRPWMIGMKAQ